ncbi:pyridoxal-dependent decarboxylase [Temperatibacter marinus]|uniref:Pyridoxal-dependent decarboxylase n=1 Tax=Temperatibacter marinus TaxID=1456591 RepID=A0AA52EKQ1_9PROT|nr:pyridoxal-dependent decarboxylase [Temperatibacter marinus]WND04019.1 pyridoxal-dependent decarboxylase [Temperatibacter marinus]
MKTNNFRKHAHELVDWVADYMENVRDYPVRSQCEPGDIAAQIEDEAPQQAENFETIFEDFKSIIMPGITHWQHPRFFAYFPSNSTPESQLAEMLISAVGVNGMLWETSPAATELEEKMMQWLGQLIAIPKDWSGVIQDTASSATFCALLCAREKATDDRSNTQGLYSEKKLKYYVTHEAHSSIEKAMKMAGLGSSNIHFVATRRDHSMDHIALETAIERDLAAGHIPAGIIACIGATGMGAIDPLRRIGEIAKAHDIYLHVDAAWAGSAMVCPEFHAFMDGIDLADSYVFNPHKWMGIQFDCSAHFVKDKDRLIQTLTILPEYLKSNEGVTDYRDWGIQLGRRMRALKVWFVLRGQGVDAIQERIRNHILWTEKLAALVSDHPDFEIVTEPRFSLFTFKHKDGCEKTDALLQAVNDAGYTYLTRSVINKKSVIRWSIGQTDCQWQDVADSWSHLLDLR